MPSEDGLFAFAEGVGSWMDRAKKTMLVPWAPADPRHPELVGESVVGRSRDPVAGLSTSPARRVGARREVLLDLTGSASTLYPMPVRKQRMAQFAVRVSRSAG